MPLFFYELTNSAVWIKRLEIKFFYNNFNTTVLPDLVTVF